MNKEAFEYAISLHDITKIAGIPSDHNKKSAKKTEVIFKDLGYSKDQIEQIKRYIIS
ncbi:MAG: hypothetical protein SWO11_20870 [Thermodesulfobacteriota bacterium]|nr:hypothetical protein [Thermodesulfobacteriota bacterium]